MKCILLTPSLILVVKVCYCTLSASPYPWKGRDAGWQLGTQPTHWTTKWEKWPAFTSSFKNSFTSCQIPLWQGTCNRAAGQDWVWVHRPCWPSSYRPDPAHRSNRQLILLCQGFLASLLLFSPRPFSTLPLVCSWQRVGDYQSAWNPTFALLYNYCTVCSPKSISREDYVC